MVLKRNDFEKRLKNKYEQDLRFEDKICLKHDLNKHQI